MYYKKLVGERVYLSPCDVNDEIETMTRWINEDQEIAFDNYFYHSLKGKEKVLELMNRFNDGPFQFSIVNKETDTFMGHVSFFGQDAHESTCTMGIYLGKEYRHQGYGKEAMLLGIDYLFKTQRYNAIHLEVFSFNEHAFKAYEKVGFEKCGTWHKAIYHLGEYHDIIMMELLRDTYLNKR